MHYMSRWVTPLPDRPDNKLSHSESMFEPDELTAVQC